MGFIDVWDAIFPSENAEERKEVKRKVHLCEMPDPEGLSDNFEWL
jgi:hypothetical protein